MPAGLTDAPKTGFWLSPATSADAKSTVETQIFPQPTWVEYPSADLGEIQETADGRVVVQVSNLDPRRRAWHWTNYGPEVPTYERQYQFMRSMRARDRRALSQSPYVYVYDATSDQLEINRSIVFATGSLSGTTATVPDFSTVVHTAHLTNAWLEILPASGGSTASYERRRVTEAGSSTSLTLESAFSSDTLGNSDMLLTWSQPAWFKARVIEVARELRNDGGPARYSDTRFVFVIDDDLNTTLSNL